MTGLEAIDLVRYEHDLRGEAEALRRHAEHLDDLPVQPAAADLGIWHLRHAALDVEKALALLGPDLRRAANEVDATLLGSLFPAHAT